MEFCLAWAVSIEGVYHLPDNGKTQSAKLEGIADNGWVNGLAKIICRKFVYMCYGEQQNSFVYCNAPMHNAIIMQMRYVSAWRIASSIHPKPKKYKNPT
jgi:hypothetical protein